MTRNIRICALALTGFATLAVDARADESSGTLAATSESTLQSEVEAATRKTNHDKIITAVYENDLIGSGRDEYYTSGVRLGYLHIGAEFPEFARDIDDIIPTFSINETSSIFYSLGQNIYTPRDIGEREQSPEDRPWAGYLYASVGMVSMTGNHTDELEVSLGVVGPPALGEQTQKFIHSHITDSPVPRGWSNQLETEPALTLGWQRAWPEYAGIETDYAVFSVSPYFGATVGNVYDFVSGGVSFRLSPRTEKWQDTPMRVRPALPGTGFFEIPEKKWSWSLFGGVEGRLMGRNIFLDGNTFRDSYSVDKKNMVGDANAGIALTYDQVRLSYTLIYRSREFEGQDEGTVFGALNLGYRF